MATSQKFTKRLLFASIPFATAIGILSNAQTNNPAVNDARLTLKGLVRIGNLISTVGLLCVDYGMIVYDHRNVKKESDIVAQELKEARLQHEQISLRRHAANKDNEKDLEQEVKNSILHLREIAVRHKLRNVRYFINFSDARLDWQFYVKMILLHLSSKLTREVQFVCIAYVNKMEGSILN